MAEEQTAYWDEMRELLRGRGLPDGHTEAVLAELAGAAHGDPAGRFGPAGALAEMLTPAPAADEHAEIWRWSADTYADAALLDRFGAEGWELERVDSLGRFVCRRDPEHPRRWEYRRAVTGTGGRPAGAGWEPCGTWTVYTWFKREKPVPEPVRGGDGAQPAPSPPRRRRLFPRRRRA
ncbi:hypothetical protein [Streptomyces xanthii]|uniref:DUF2812 domain-containing protein n=1 Tax=Streptomyces xanthii TaxID=2768069 RepID=A0A7H1BDZ6_9ACTN|nr:hypothetical protein [Streptomyces xanthii]QNS06951.1 hypothetical protein IAG42_27440 [Streptomyces xanthii]